MLRPIQFFAGRLPQTMLVAAGFVIVTQLLPAGASAEDPAAIPNCGTGQIGCCCMLNGFVEPEVDQAYCEFAGSGVWSYNFQEVSEYCGTQPSVYYCDNRQAVIDGKNANPQVSVTPECGEYEPGTFDQEPEGEEGWYYLNQSECRTYCGLGCSDCADTTDKTRCINNPKCNWSEETPIISTSGSNAKFVCTPKVEACTANSSSKSSRKSASSRRKRSSAGSSYAVSAASADSSPASSTSSVSSYSSASSQPSSQSSYSSSKKSSASSSVGSFFFGYCDPQTATVYVYTESDIPQGVNAEKVDIDTFIADLEYGANHMNLGDPLTSTAVEALREDCIADPSASSRAGSAMPTITVPIGDTTASSAASSEASSDASSNGSSSSAASSASSSADSDWYGDSLMGTPNDCKVFSGNMTLGTNEVWVSAAKFTEAQCEADVLPKLKTKVIACVPNTGCTQMSAADANALHVTSYQGTLVGLGFCIAHMLTNCIALGQ